MVFRQIIAGLIYLFAASLALIMFSGVIAVALLVVVFGDLYWRWRIRRSMHQFKEALHRSAAMSSQTTQDDHVLEGEFQVIEPQDEVLPDGTQKPKS